MLDNDTQIDVSIFGTFGYARTTLSCTTVGELLITLKKWKRDHYSDICVNWGKTAGPLVEDLRREIARASVQYTQVGSTLFDNWPTSKQEPLNSYESFVERFNKFKKQESETGLDEQSYPEGTWHQWVTTDSFALWRSILGYVLTCVGFVCAIGTYLVLGPQFNRSEGLSHVVNGILLILGGALVLGIFRISKRLRARGALAALRSDRRAPVLFLRAFADEELSIENLNPKRSFLAFAQDEFKSFEEVIWPVFQDLGPIIAIGRPGEILAPLGGAARFWVSDEKWENAIGDLARMTQFPRDVRRKLNLWQKVVDQLVQESRLIVMLMGLTQGDDGLAWELSRVLRRQQLSKLLLVMPPVPEEEAKRRWARFAFMFEGLMPQYQGGELVAMFSKEGKCIPGRMPRASGRAASDATYVGFLAGLVDTFYT
jgi:hypothetical protein